MYAANHYVRVKGKLYVAGELLPEDLPQEKIDWLLRKGAITRVKEFSAAASGPAPDNAAAAPADLSEGENDAEAEPVPEDTPEDDIDTEAEPVPEDTPEDDIDTEAEPEEIDAADGIVAAPAPEKSGKGRKGGKAK